MRPCLEPHRSPSLGSLTTQEPLCFSSPSPDQEAGQWHEAKPSARVCQPGGAGVGVAESQRGGMGPCSSAVMCRRDSSHVPTLLWVIGFSASTSTRRWSERCVSPPPRMSLRSSSSTWMCPPCRRSTPGTSSRSAEWTTSCSGPQGRTRGGGTGLLPLSSEVTLGALLCPAGLGSSSASTQQQRSLR